MSLTEENENSIANAAITVMSWYQCQAFNQSGTW